MKGYKIAVGIDKEYGPFPVMVELDIPEDAIVVVPEDKVAVEVENCSDVGYRILPRTEVKLIQKCRTNKVKVVGMYPLMSFVSKWNHKAYSFFELNKIRACLYGNPYYNFDCITIYSIGAELFETVWRSKKQSCGPGINYFESAEDAENYYYCDTNSWALNLMHRFRNIWCSLLLECFDERFKKAMLILSKEGELDE